MLLKKINLVTLWKIFHRVFQKLTPLTRLVVQVRPQYVTEVRCVMRQKTIILSRSRVLKLT